MKNIILSFLLLFSIFCVAQNTIYVRYNLQIINETEIFKGKLEMRETFLKIVNEPNKPSFGLIFSENKSIFFKEDRIGTNSENNLIDAFAGYEGIVYSKSDSIYIQKRSLGKNIYLGKGKTENWILENDSKFIDGRLCYKATNTNKIKNQIKTFYHPVTAWYCPELPFNIGPNGYGNLPGAILELQVRNVIFTMETIDLKSNEKLDLKTLRNSKILSEDEVYDIYINIHQDDMKKYGNLGK
jgi:GLPGLI family protein